MCWVVVRQSSVERGNFQLYENLQAEGRYDGYAYNLVFKYTTTLDLYTCICRMYTKLYLYQ